MKKTSILQLNNLTISVEGKVVVKKVSLRIKSGQIHVLMGPNGSGKSTLLQALMGKEEYKLETSKQVRSSYLKKSVRDEKTSLNSVPVLSNKKPKITIGEKSIINMSPDERAKEGLYLAMQSPVPVPGVSVMNLLRTGYQAVYGNNGEKRNVHNPLFARRWNVSSVSIGEFNNKVKQFAKILHIQEKLLHRGIHDGFSGGERKKIEMLQALVLEPKFVLLDEIDTGLDVDVLKIVAKAISLLKKNNTGVLLITHYQRILQFVKPDFVHILIDGSIKASGDFSLVKKVEHLGYKAFSG